MFGADLDLRDGALSPHEQRITHFPANSGNTVCQKYPLQSGSRWLALGLANGRDPARPDRFRSDRQDD